MKPPADSKRPSRTHALLLLAFAAAALLSCRSALRSCNQPPPPSLPPTYPWNSTLLRLARNETAVPLGLAELLAFLANPDDPSARLLARRAGRTPSLLPAFRRAALSWSRALHLDSADPSPLYSADPSPLYSDLLRDPSPPRRYPSCAVVGNSGTLLRRRHGAAIDAHDLVVRLNNAPVAGFEPHVGSRTDLAFVNSNILFLCNRGGRCRCRPYGHAVPLLMYLCQVSHLLDYAACSVAGGPLLATDPRFDQLCARLVKYYSLKRFTEQAGRPTEKWAETHDAALFHYSSGMQAVMLAVGMCERVSLYGFGKAAGAHHHYHTKQAKELDLHDYEAEYELYADLAGRPAAVPFLGDAGFKVPPVEIHH